MRGAEAVKGLRVGRYQLLISIRYEYDIYRYLAFYSIRAIDFKIMTSNSRFLLWHEQNYFEYGLESRVLIPKDTYICQIQTIHSDMAITQK